MGKIVSRANTESAAIKQLQDTLVLNSLGAITIDGAGIEQVGSDLPTLVLQTDSVLQGMLQTLEYASADLSVARMEAAQYSLKIDELESVVECLLGDVGFDGALDAATTDLMDCLASSGAAETTADGKLVFDERVTFSKEDIKPYLQHAITTWIEQRLQG